MSAKRAIDASVSAVGLAVLSPLMAGVAAAIWLSDRQTPIFVAKRCGRGGAPFNMYKFRSMVTGAQNTGVTSTGNNDPRITRIGHTIRALKIDEIPQLINVLRGDMSVVGPRPNTIDAVAGYSVQERDLLTVRPGITDIASIVFADEGAILADESDPDLAYEQLIRPGKSKLGLIYAANASPRVDLRIIYLTAVNSVSRQKALAGVCRLLQDLGAPAELVRLASREGALAAGVPRQRVLDERASV